MPVINDDFVAFLLIATWTLVTGRELRSDVPPGELTEQELVDFWADDHLWPADTWNDRYPVPADRGPATANLRGMRS
jgi:hypothetical protein